MEKQRTAKLRYQKNLEGRRQEWRRSRSYRQHQSEEDPGKRVRKEDPGLRYAGAIYHFPDQYGVVDVLRPEQAFHPGLVCRYAPPRPFWSYIFLLHGTSQRRESYLTEPFPITRSDLELRPAHALPGARLMRKGQTTWFSLFPFTMPVQVMQQHLDKYLGTLKPAKEEEIYQHYEKYLDTVLSGLEK